MADVPTNQQQASSSELGAAPDTTDNAANPAGQGDASRTGGGDPATAAPPSNMPVNPAVFGAGGMPVYAQPVPMGLPYGQPGMVYPAGVANGYNGEPYFNGDTEAMDPNAGVFDPNQLFSAPIPHMAGYGNYIPGQPDMAMRGGFMSGRGRGRGRGRGKRLPHDSRWGGRGGHRPTGGAHDQSNEKPAENSSTGSTEAPADQTGEKINGVNHALGMRSAPYHSRAAARDTGEVSSTNLYMRGLKPSTTDDELRQMCQEFGKIVSTKAIIDHETKQCKGYGFVMFESESAALAAIDGLNSRGVQATFAKITRPHNDQSGMHDPTNLYLSNLPRDMDENALSDLLGYHGNVTSCRVLRDQSGTSRGVALARMDTRAVCHTVIQNFNGQRLPGSKEPLVVKFADGPGMRKAKQSRQMERRAPPMGMYPYYDPVMYDQSMWSVNTLPQPVGPFPGYGAPVPAVAGGVPVVPVVYPPGAAGPIPLHMNGGAAAPMAQPVALQQPQQQQPTNQQEGEASSTTSNTGIEDMSSLSTSLPEASASTSRDPTTTTATNNNNNN